MLYTVNINGIEYDDYWKLNVKRVQGQLYEAEVMYPSLRDIDDGDNITEDKLIKIYRDEREIFKGVIRQIDYDDDENATVRANNMPIKLYDEMVMERRDYINKTPNEIYVGYRDAAVSAQPNGASTNLKVVSSSNNDSSRIRVFGKDNSSNWVDETVIMTGTTNATTSTNFQYVAYASLVNSAVGTVTVKDSLDNTLGSFSATQYTIADEDDFGHYGNGYLYFPENTSLNEFYGFVTNIDTTVNAITTRNEYDNRLIACARVANQTDYEWYVDEDSSNDMIYDSV